MKEINSDIAQTIEEKNDLLERAAKYNQIGNHPTR